MCCYWPLFMFTCFVVCIVCHLDSIPLMDLEGSPRHQGISIWKRQMCKLCISPGDWYSPCSPRPCSFRTPIFLTCWRINRGEGCNVATCLLLLLSSAKLCMMLLEWNRLLLQRVVAESCYCVMLWESGVLYLPSYLLTKTNTQKLGSWFSHILKDHPWVFKSRECFSGQFSMTHNS